MRFSSCATFAAAAACGFSQPAAVSGGDGGAAAARAWQHHSARAHAALASLQQSARTPLPAPPAGVADLAFADFFGPIGDRGLEYSPKLRALDGRVVRLVGYMVREQEHHPGLFLLAGWPAIVQTKGLCALDTVPPSAVHVIVPSAASRPVPYRPGRIVLTGRLELGPRPEADGRNSVIRLFLDGASAAPLAPTAAAESESQ